MFKTDIIVLPPVLSSEFTGSMNVEPMGICVCMCPFIFLDFTVCCLLWLLKRNPPNCTANTLQSEGYLLMFSYSFTDLNIIITYCKFSKSVESKSTHFDNSPALVSVFLPVV